MITQSHAHKHIHTHTRINIVTTQGRTLRSNANRSTHPYATKVNLMRTHHGVSIKQSPNNPPVKKNTHKHTHNNNNFFITVSDQAEKCWLETYSHHGNFITTTSVPPGKDSPHSLPQLSCYPSCWSSFSPFSSPFPAFLCLPFPHSLLPLWSVVTCLLFSPPTPLRKPHMNRTLISFRRNLKKTGGDKILGECEDKWDLLWISKWYTRVCLLYCTTPATEFNQCARVLKLNNVKSQSRGCGTYRNSGHECPPTDLSDDCVTGGGKLTKLTSCQVHKYSSSRWLLYLY